MSASHPRGWVSGVQRAVITNFMAASPNGVVSFVEGKRLRILMDETKVLLPERCA
jgi:hypothetical protein